MIGRMMACGTSSSAARENSVANQSPTRLEMRLMVCFIPRFLSLLIRFMACWPPSRSGWRRIGGSLLRCSSPLPFQEFAVPPVVVDVALDAVAYSVWALVVLV